MIPIEIINIILEYCGYHKYRNGKFMKQLKIENYEKLLSIPPKKNGSVNFMKYSKRYTYEYTIDILEYNGFISWYLEKKSTNLITNNSFTTIINYIYEKHAKLNKPKL